MLWKKGDIFFAMACSCVPRWTAPQPHRCPMYRTFSFVYWFYFTQHRLERCTLMTASCVRKLLESSLCPILTYFAVRVCISENIPNEKHGIRFIFSCSNCVPLTNQTTNSTDMFLIIRDSYPSILAIHLALLVYSTQGLVWRRDVISAASEFNVATRSWSRYYFFKKRNEQVRRSGRLAGGQVGR